MARIRSIKPEFPHSESMGRVSRDARLTFVELWTICDDAGRTRGASRMLASLLFPYDSDAPKKIDQWLGELEREECIVRYTVEGNQYIQVTNWLSHQRIDRPSLSKIPPFDEHSRMLANSRECSCEDRKGVEGSGEEGNGNGNGTLANEFDEFWKVYPSGRKSSKAKAREAWDKATKKKPAADIIAAAIEYAASPVGNGQFVKGPAVWLNGECWDDDRNSWNRKDEDDAKPKRFGAGQVFDANAKPDGF